MHNCTWDCCLCSSMAVSSSSGVLAPRSLEYRAFECAVAAACSRATPQKLECASFLDQAGAVQGCSS